MQCTRKPPGPPFAIRERAVASLAVSPAELLLEKRFVIHDPAPFIRPEPGLTVAGDRQGRHRGALASLVDVPVIQNQRYSTPAQIAPTSWAARYTRMPS